MGTTIYILFALNLMIMSWLLFDSFKIKKQIKKWNNEGLYDNVKPYKKSKNKIRRSLYIFMGVTYLICIALLIMNGGF
ncbi:hypothetical protein [Williamsoniiplasma lucivorax]|uniref:Uncharacterized protein n=1 Tax=Williamsoniiplasma lucivorax TaxID=209274 RepID=A0A2S5RF57_9MOLU|nr:hypothetical protein [Williamsoniiplasma lucivorax]PPE05966.1 hypothetical protein ELUCI_v1c02570 [Williamsoniiplasma lucivorax]